MSVLVTGGAGFIGSHLVDRLLSAGKDVVCADRLVFGSTANIDHLRGNGGFRFEKIDLADLDAVIALFEKYDFECVYHLAANSDIQKGGQEPGVDFHDTLMTTRCVLEGMRATGVKRLFFASTSAVYGEHGDETLYENSGGLLPISYYGGAKLASEALISSYASMCDLQVVTFRFPNVVGPRLTHGVIFDFVLKLKKDNSRLEILGDGTQCKSYIYVHDLVDAILFATKKWLPGMAIYNVDSLGDTGTSVERIAEIVVGTMGLSDVSFDYTGGDRGWKGDVPKFSYDTSKLASAGWVASHSSDESVRLAAEASVESMA